MEVIEHEDKLTARVNGVTLEPSNFEEQRFLARLMQVCKSGQGKIMILTEAARMTWKPTKPAKKQ